MTAGAVRMTKQDLPADECDAMMRHLYELDRLDDDLAALESEIVKDSRSRIRSLCG